MKLDMNPSSDGYTGLLEVNSNKFYVNFSLTEEGIIAEFEIFSAKGYFELNLKVIKMIRNIVQNLYSLA